MNRKSLRQSRNSRLQYFLGEAAQPEPQLQHRRHADNAGAVPERWRASVNLAFGSLWAAHVASEPTDQDVRLKAADDALRLLSALLTKAERRRSGSAAYRAMVASVMAD